MGSAVLLNPPGHRRRRNPMAMYNPAKGYVKDRKVVIASGKQNLEKLLKASGVDFYPKFSEKMLSSALRKVHEEKDARTMGTWAQSGFPVTDKELVEQYKFAVAVAKEAHPKRKLNPFEYDATEGVVWIEPKKTIKKRAATKSKSKTKRKARKAVVKKIIKKVSKAMKNRKFASKKGVTAIKKYMAWVRSHKPSTKMRARLHATRAWSRAYAKRARGRAKSIRAPLVIFAPQSQKFSLRRKRLRVAVDSRMGNGYYAKRVGAYRKRRGISAKHKSLYGKKGQQTFNRLFSHAGVRHNRPRRRNPGFPTFRELFDRNNTFSLGLGFVSEYAGCFLAENKAVEMAAPRLLIEKNPNKTGEKMVKEYMTMKSGVQAVGGVAATGLASWIVKMSQPQSVTSMPVLWGGILTAAIKFGATALVIAPNEAKKIKTSADFDAFRSKEVRKFAQPFANVLLGLAKGSSGIQSNDSAVQQVLMNNGIKIKASGDTVSSLGVTVDQVREIAAKLGAGNTPVTLENIKAAYDSIYNASGDNPLADYVEVPRGRRRIGMSDNVLNDGVVLGDNVLNDYAELPTEFPPVRQGMGDWVEDEPNDGMSDYFGVNSVSPLYGGRY